MPSTIMTPSMCVKWRESHFNIKSGITLIQIFDRESARWIDKKETDRGRKREIKREGGEER